MAVMKKASVDMLHGPLWKKIMMLTVPIILSSILQQLFNTADIAVAGKFVSDEAMAAVGSNAPVIALFISMITGLSVGANVLVAMYIGRKQYDRVRISLHTAMGAACIFGLLLLLGGVAIARPILDLTAVPRDILGMAETYLRIYFLGMPFLMIYNFGSAILRADGDSWRPLYCLIFSSLTNLVLDLIFVLVLPWGIAGLAWATTIANGLSAVMVIYYLIQEKTYLHLDLRQLKLQKECIYQIVSIGGPAALQGIVFSLSNIVIQTAINGFGADAVAGVAAALNFEYFAYYVVSGFAQAAVTFTSQNYAVNDMDRCQRIFRLSIWSAICFTMVLSSVFIVFRYPLLHIFTANEEVMSYALVRLLMVTSLEFMTAIYEIPGSCLRGMGISMLPALETLFGSCLLRIFFVMTIFKQLPHFTLLMGIYPVTWFITGIIVMTTYVAMRKRVFQGKIRTAI
jgi:putative MATE family efflux protein